MTHQVSNPYETTGFLGRMHKTTNSGLNASSCFLSWICP